MVRRQREHSTTEDEIVIGNQLALIWKWIRSTLSKSINSSHIFSDTPPPKKHKRHKHKKHKKRKIENDFDSDTSIDVAYEDTMDKPFKVKVRCGKDIPGTSAADLLKAQAMKSSSDSRRSIPGSSSSTPPKVASKKKKKGRDSGTSSEEERWLDAIKSGKLEEVCIKINMIELNFFLFYVFTSFIYRLMKSSKK